MAESGQTRSQSTHAEAFYGEMDDAANAIIEAIVTAAMKQQGFTKTLKSLNRGRIPAGGMMTVHEGVVEELPSGLYDAAFQTDKGPLLLRNAEGPDRETTDPQMVHSIASQFICTDAEYGDLTAEQIVRQLTDAGANPSSRLVCTIELTRFDSSQQKVLLPLLWQYILDNRNSNDRGELVAVGAAIRKYVAIMPMDRMGELAVLLKSGHRSPIPIELEIEVAKMIYRNFETHPPVVVDPQSELAQRLWEMVQAYVNPRILLRDKHPAAASLAIEAIVSMRSPLAAQAWQAAVACPYRWFAELVSDDLDDLHETWRSKNPDAAAWLGELRSHVLADV